MRRKFPGDYVGYFLFGCGALFLILLLLWGIAGLVGVE